ncbi:MAG: D-tyrosyl-tRNA(Tyr) deacylase [Clostridia bacterium]|nr:D-tyrosyl-tRNA(Tyr) deacylase [Clostridia bacterium]
MKAVIQRVASASVFIDGVIVGKCAQGLMVLLGIAADDTEEDARIMTQKLIKLRIFCDEQGKMNRSVADIGGEMLVVSNFTLLADTSHGNRPSFIGAGDPTRAEELYKYVLSELHKTGIPVQSGRFGADMRVSIENDGPVTILLDTAQWIKKTC